MRRRKRSTYSLLQPPPTHETTIAGLLRGEGWNIVLRPSDAVHPEMHILGPVHADRWPSYPSCASVYARVGFAEMHKKAYRRIIRTVTTVLITKGSARIDLIVKVRNDDNYCEMLLRRSTV